MAPAVTPGVSSVFPPSPCLPPPLCFLCMCVYVGMASRHSAPVQSPHLHRHVINFYLKALVSPPLVAKLFCHPQVVYTLGRAVLCLRQFYSPVLLFFMPSSNYCVVVFRLPLPAMSSPTCPGESLSPLHQQLHSGPQPCPASPLPPAPTNPFPFNE